MTATQDAARHPAPPEAPVAPARGLTDRLVELRAELLEGRRALQALDARRDEMVASLLRIEGAVQVLEELLRGTDKAG